MTLNQLGKVLDGYQMTALIETDYGCTVYRIYESLTEFAVAYSERDCEESSATYGDFADWRVKQFLARSDCWRWVESNCN